MMVLVAGEHANRLKTNKLVTRMGTNFFNSENMLASLQKLANSISVTAVNAYYGIFLKIRHMIFLAFFILAYNSAP